MALVFAVILLVVTFSSAVIFITTKKCAGKREAKRGEMYR